MGVLAEKRKNAHMVSELIRLSELKAGQRATIASVDTLNPLGQRLLEMGVASGVSVIMVRFAPMGDPMEFKVGDTHLLLRRQEAQAIQVCHVNTP